MISNQARGLNKGPGPVRGSLDETQNRVYFAVQFCRQVEQAKQCLEVAFGQNTPFADRMRELARDAGRRARSYYAEAMGKGAVAA